MTGFSGVSGYNNETVYKEENYEDKYEKKEKIEEDNFDKKEKILEKKKPVVVFQQSIVIKSEKCEGLVPKIFDNYIPRLRNTVRKCYIEGGILNHVKARIITVIVITAISLIAALMCRLALFLLSLKPFLGGNVDSDDIQSIGKCSSMASMLYGQTARAFFIGGFSPHIALKLDSKFWNERNDLSYSEKKHQVIYKNEEFEKDYIEEKDDIEEEIENKKFAWVDESKYINNNNEEN